MVANLEDRPLYRRPKLEEFIDKFSGDGATDRVEVWIEQLKHPFYPYGMSNAEKLHTTRKLLSGTAALLAKNANAASFEGATDHF
ncbi:hypothetical protein AND_001612 [Anopheles darlingi]|uniref:Uncharacterized protein n=1 Tax=Anopheles darlingi TaxID=43151 RepID=W5JTI7_ANODA|nr:hypothetical protein AND_001612 [Anopheles darlingi]